MTQPTKRGRSRPASHAADVALARAAAGGDRGARRQLVERLLDRVRAEVTYLAGRDPDADDCAQLALIEILRSVGTYRGDASLETWAERIVVRTTLRHLRQRRGRAEVVSLVLAPEQADRRTGEDAVGRMQISSRMEEMMESLPAQQRTAVVLQLVFGHSVMEIAEMTDSRPNTIRDRLQRGRRLLRKRLRKSPFFQEWLGGTGS